MDTQVLQHSLGTENTALTLAKVLQPAVCTEFGYLQTF